MRSIPTRRLRTVATACVALLVGAVPSSATRAQLAQPGEGYTLVQTFPHDPEAFTQGLEFRGRRLFETTGLEGRSSLRRVELKTGKVLRREGLSREHFGEGMTIFGDKLFWLTWRSQVAFEYEPQTFRRTGRSIYAGEGWGLTHNKRRLVMSNGTAQLAFRDPRNFAITRSILVTDEGDPVDQLNELEWIRGEILANVWQTSRIARIDPTSGEVLGWIDIGALWEAERSAGDPDVPNGIAYMRDGKRLFVTGKFWQHVYEIELTG